MSRGGVEAPGRRAGRPRGGVLKPRRRSPQLSDANDLGGSREDSMSAALAWLGDYGRVRRWMARHDARRALAAGGGIAWFPDFLPGPVAHAALSILESVPDSQWNATVAYEDRTSNDIAHQFWSLKAGGARSPLAALLRVFPVLLPDEPYSTFSAARYDCSHHIDPHDDRAYTQVQRDDGGQEGG